MSLFTFVLQAKFEGYALLHLQFRDFLITFPIYCLVFR